MSTIFFNSIDNKIELSHNENMENSTKTLDPHKLREARIRAGVKAKDIASLLEVGKSQVANIEKGRSVLDANKLIRWCEACSVDNPLELFS